MFNFIVTDPRTGETIEKTFKALKGAVMFDWGYNPKTGQNDIPSASFFKDVTAAQNALNGRVMEGVIIQAIQPVR